MRIVVDLQGVQTESRFRGIGRYSLNFAKALIRNRGSDTIIIALNAMFPETIGPIRTSFAGLLPDENIVVWDAPGPVAELDSTNHRRRDAAELIREAFLASLNPDVVHLTSLFEGYVDNAVTSIGRYETRLPVSVTLYDLIPYQNQDGYLTPNMAYAAHYLRKIGHLKRASTLLAISRSAGDEAVNALGWDPEGVVAVGTGSDSRFGKVRVPLEQQRTLRARFGLELPFFMYVSAPDVHKNHRRLIEAYAQIPDHIRQRHRLALVGRFSEAHCRAFAEHADRHGLTGPELVLVKGVSDDDLNALYNCAKGFIIPSWHEGFGLPAVEAMQCGRAVIGSCTSSLPEVIGRADALFDPFDTDDIARAIVRLAEDDAWRAELEADAVSRAAVFDWESVARRALGHLRKVRHSCARVVAPAPNQRRPRLAFVSPLPPARSGISDYSAELLPELAVHYDVDVIVDQPQVEEQFISANFPIRSTEWFRDNADEFERIIYQFGNSPLHAYMFRMLEEHPGVVVLHDFFLSAVQAERRFSDWNPNVFDEALQTSHGYFAVHEVRASAGAADAARSYPVNLPVLQNALGVIVHSEHARRLAEDWYGLGCSSEWAVIPLLRSAPNGATRAAARAALGIAPDDLIVCSFGFLDPVKLNHRLLDAWIASPLSTDQGARLIFVGQNHGHDYGTALDRRIHETRGGERINITGWTDATLFRQYLAAADIGVQLRTTSRGEMSASVLDCLNYGLATIVNAHGAMAELDPATVCMLPDAFTDVELGAALNTLAGDRDLRLALGGRARAHIRTWHAPRQCAEQYALAIETAYTRAETALYGLTERLRTSRLAQDDGARIATALARNFPPAPRRRQLLVDVSSLARADLRSGIERVVRSILNEWLRNPPRGWAVEPVYADESMGGYRYARQFSHQLLGLTEIAAHDSVVDAWGGDVFIGLDFQPYVVMAQQGCLEEWHNRGIGIWFVVYDLLPISMPWFFPEGAATVHESWLEAISRFDGVVCISRSVAGDFSNWLAKRNDVQRMSLRIEWYHNGADVERSLPTRGRAKDAGAVLATLRDRPSFLMVGTIEPRKGHLQVIAAFENLWRDDIGVNLVIVGAEGWKPLPDTQRRTIPRIVQKLRNHPELGKRLFWLEGISDEYLEELYEAATCLVAASEGEGFGLPLIEAAQHELPILARDIPVFREVAGDHATYFRGLEAEELAKAIRNWIRLNAAGKAPGSTALPWHTWAQSAAELLTSIGLLTDYPAKDELTGCAEPDASLPCELDDGDGPVGETQG